MVVWRTGLDGGRRGCLTPFPLILKWINSAQQTAYEGERRLVVAAGVSGLAGRAAAAAPRRRAHFGCKLQQFAHEMLANGLFCSLPPRRPPLPPMPPQLPPAHSKERIVLSHIRRHRLSILNVNLSLSLIRLLVKLQRVEPFNLSIYNMYI